jgi:RNAse (barnase) inhibitor barstar
VSTLYQRQFNVQEQNAHDEQAILATATRWRTNALPGALKSAGEDRGIDWSKAIILKLEINFPGMPELFGQLLSQGERFIDFEISTEPEHHIALKVESWIDVTGEQNISLHNPGTGVGRGALALKVLHRLNHEIDINVAEVSTREALHQLLADAFQFPDYYGRNWDAFNDCIRDVELPRRVTIRGLEELRRKLPREAELLTRCVGDFVDEDPGRSIVFSP